jgi:hypothetical protein
MKELGAGLSSARSPGTSRHIRERRKRRVHEERTNFAWGCNCAAHLALSPPGRYGTGPANRHQ